MKLLVDTNVLLRVAEPGHAQYPDAKAAILALRGQGFGLCVVPQVVYEFWVNCTRPIKVNGLGKTAQEAATELASVRADFTLLEDTSAILQAWEQLVTTHHVLGKNAHDARLVAAMLVHGVGHLLTFNAADFARFTAITVLTPAAVGTPPVPPTP